MEAWICVFEDIVIDSILVNNGIVSFGVGGDWDDDNGNWLFGYYWNWIDNWSWINFWSWLRGGDDDDSNWLFGYHWSRFNFWLRSEWKVSIVGKLINLGAARSTSTDVQVCSSNISEGVDLCWSRSWCNVRRGARYGIDISGCVSKISTQGLDSSGLSVNWFWSWRCNWSWRWITITIAFKILKEHFHSNLLLSLMVINLVKEMMVKHFFLYFMFLIIIIIDI